jgi:hypothetical protein
MPIDGAEKDVSMKNLSPKEEITILESMKVDIPLPKAAVTQIKRNLALDMAINALNCSEIPNSSDTISRQQAIDALDKRFDKIPMGQTTEILMLRKDLRELPPVQPEREKGEWVYNSPVTMKCNRCGLVIKDWDWQRFKICPNCGADMRGKTE